MRRSFELQGTYPGRGGLHALQRKDDEPLRSYIQRLRGPTLFRAFSSRSFIRLNGVRLSHARRSPPRPKTLRALVADKILRKESVGTELPTRSACCSESVTALGGESEGKRKPPLRREPVLAAMGLTGPAQVKSHRR